MQTAEFTPAADPTPPRAAPFALDGFERLHPNARLNWILGGLIGVGVMMFIGAVVELSIAHNARRWPFPWPRLVPTFSLAGGAAMALLSVVSATMRYSRFGYRLADTDLIVQSGVLWRTRRCVPRERIQHVTMNSGPIDRAFGVVEVHLFVAGGMGAVASIHGLSPDAAERLKEALVDSRADGV